MTWRLRRDEIGLPKLVSGKVSNNWTVWNAIAGWKISQGRASIQLLMGALFSEGRRVAWLFSATGNQCAILAQFGRGDCGEMRPVLIVPAWPMKRGFARMTTKTPGGKAEIAPPGPAGRRTLVAAKMSVLAEA